MAKLEQLKRANEELQKAIDVGRAADKV